MHVCPPPGAPPAGCSSHRPDGPLSAQCCHREEGDQRGGGGRGDEDPGAAVHDSSAAPDAALLREPQLKDAGLWVFVRM